MKFFSIQTLCYESEIYGTGTAVCIYVIIFFCDEGRILSVVESEVNHLGVHDIWKDIIWHRRKEKEKKRGTKINSKNTFLMSNIGYTQSRQDAVAITTITTIII